MTNAEGTAWMYDVDVYPKNQSDEITKEVKDLGTVTAENGKVGDHNIVYTLKSTITDGLVAKKGATESDEQFAERAKTDIGKYEVYDDLDARLTSSKVVAALSDGAVLSRCAAEDVDSMTCDYMVYTDNAFQAADAEVANGPVIEVKMTKSGLAKLAKANEADSSAMVVTTITAKITEEKNGIIPNISSFIPNKRWEDSHPTGTGEKPRIPSNEVKSYYGDLKITKTGENDAPLSGATFAVYADANHDGQCTKADDVDGKAAINSAQSATDGNKAALTIKGLLASNWYDGKEQADLRGYCFIETAAPDGSL